MTWKLHPAAQFPALAEAWNRLQADTTATPFLESAFLEPLLETFGTGQEIVAVQTMSGHARCATIVRPARHGFWEVFNPSQLPLGAWIGPRDGDLHADARSLIDALPRLCLGLNLPQIDPRLLRRPADDAYGRTQDYVRTAWVDIGGGFEAYWAARGKNLKQNVRKQRNKLQAEGTRVRLECVTEPAAVAAALADYGTLEAAGWKAANGTAVQADNAQGRFYRNMMENFCRLGRGRIYRYSFDERPVAMDLCIDNGSALVILKTAYDESYKTISPSTLMRHDEFGMLFEEGRFSRIEFYGKVMEWHTRWTSDERTLFHDTVYRWPLLRSLHERLKQARRTDAPVAEAPSAAEAPAP